MAKLIFLLFAFTLLTPFGLGQEGQEGQEGLGRADEKECGGFCNLDCNEYFPNKTYSICLGQKVHCCAELGATTEPDETPPPPTPPPEPTTEEPTSTSNPETSAEPTTESTENSTEMTTNETPTDELNARKGRGRSSDVHRIGKHFEGHVNRTHVSSHAFLAWTTGLIIFSVLASCGCIVCFCGLLCWYYTKDNETSKGASPIPPNPTYIYVYAI